MEAIADYVKTIAFYMIFSALVEIIAPSGSFKKYIRLITSIILIALLIQPFSAVLRGANGYFENNLLKIQSVFESAELNTEREEYNRKNASAVLDEYKKSLSEQTKRIIENRTGLSVTQADFIVNEDYDDENFAEILGVYVTVSIPKREGEISTAKKILLGNANAQISGEEIKRAAEQKIKICLMDFYNAPEGNIYITVLDG